MTIAKGRPWGDARPLPPDGLIAASDAELRGIVERARREGTPLPVVGLLGGDLCTTLGGRGDRDRLRSAAAMTFPVDVIRVDAGGMSRWFVAHLIARSRLAKKSVAVLNGAWLGPWNVAPKSHPNDGLVDVIEADLRIADIPAVRVRLPHGAHLPHPRIRTRRVATVDLDLRGLRVRLDGEVEPVGPSARVTVEPDALAVVV